MILLIYSIFEKSLNICFMRQSNIHELHVGYLIHNIVPFNSISKNPFNIYFMKQFKKFTLLHVGYHIT